MAMNGNKIESLSAKKEKALAALIAQPTLPLAAAQAGVGHRTLCRWLAEDEAFQNEYLKLHQEIVNNVTLQLQKSMNNAVNCLLSVINDPEESSTVRVAAAKEILALGYREFEVEILEQKLKALEGAHENVGFNGHRQEN
jgi:ribosomal protein S3